MAGNHLAAWRNARLHPEERKPDDVRSAAAIDRDRVIYSSALRRLAGVTQVVSAGEGHVYHNRLTHSLKVAQLARRIAERLLEQTDAGVLAAAGGLDPEVAEAAGLAHDLGHPPFGHIAEVELDRLMGTPGYEGNAQSLRILCRLSRRGSDHEGLNLTRATIRAVLKYPWFREVGPDNKPAASKAGRKWGAYHEDEDVFQFSQEGAADAVKSLEAELMDWADDVTYAVHDLDDFYRAGLVPLDRLAQIDDERTHLLEHARDRGKFYVQPFPTDRAKEVLEVEFAPYFPTFEYSGNRPQQRDGHRLTSALIHKYANAISVRPSRTEEGWTDVPDEVRFQVELLKEITWAYVIERPALATQQYGQRQIVRHLFLAYRRALKEAERDPLRCIVPPSFIDLVGTCDPPRLAADIVASLTEQEAVAMHLRMGGVQGGSIHDVVSGGRW